ncbi:hypothetical protein Ocin01_04416 [Orchesella cincta]|uniref:Uncharacterized protein n=1 Tax=Orchesella cincta TaxID=48709 RepID=A0A1D2NB09_ORCCI|nr:hypothetical protein Ocin01_04416 [Orchesella cincta]
MIRMARQKEKKAKLVKPDVWLEVKRKYKSKDQLQPASSIVNRSEAPKSDSTSQELRDVKPSKNLLTFFTTSKLMSKTSVTLGGASPYATISRRKTSNHCDDLVDYYESCCEENDSVSSLPIPKTSHSFQTDNKKKCSSSMPRLFTLPTSIGDSLPSIFEEDPFSFLDEYDTKDYPEYFLPVRRETKACKQWLALESSGDYEKLDTTNDYCARPYCLLIGDERMPSTWINAEYKCSNPFGHFKLLRQFDNHTNWLPENRRYPTPQCDVNPNIFKCAIEQKQWNNQGYYSDMVEGYISQAGGFPRMIRFPKELQRFKEICPKCNSSKNLLWDEMTYRFKMERARFRHHMDERIAKRAKSGESNPYPKYHGLRGNTKGKLFPHVNPNAVSPSIKPNDVDDPFHFPINADDMVVCKCMKINGQFEDFDEGPSSYKNVKEGQEKDVCETHSDTKPEKVNDFKAAGESIKGYRGTALLKAWSKS